MSRPLPQGYSRAVPIGKGSFGQVFRARQDDLGRWVALKEVPRGDKTARDEAQALAASPLSCLPAVYGVVVGRRSEWISMEYVHGVRLREVLAQGLEPSEAASLACAVVRSLAVLHAAGRDHGDFKPENAILEPDGRIRLVDLGFSGSGMDSVAGGTAGYIAPERGSSRCDGRRADLWSLGVVVHEILVGARPGPSEGGAGWKRLRQVASDWVPLVDLLLRDDPSRRPSAADRILSDIPEVGAFGSGFLERIHEQSDRDLASRMVEEAAYLLRDDSPSEALSLLQQALELDPDQSGALGLLPQVRLDKKRHTLPRWGVVAFLVVALGGALAAAVAHRHRPAGSTIRAYLQKDSGNAERLRTGSGQDSHLRGSLPLRDGKGVGR